jgi:hypothetical protein
MNDSQDFKDLAARVAEIDDVDEISDEDISLFLELMDLYVDDFGDDNE